MPFPGYPLDATRTNNTPMTDRHPLDHVEERTALNDLQAQIDALPPSAAAITQVFTVNGVWNRPAGILFAVVEVVGGGGAGGGAPASTGTNLSGGGAGAAGGYARKTISAGALDVTETVTVGAGGAGVSGAAGGTGGTSSFGAHCSATGGEGGQSIVAAAAATPRVALTSAIASGIGSNGDVNAIGGYPGDFIQATGGSSVSVGTGGSSFFGSGARLALETNGSAATTPGAGGGGMRNNGVQAARTGGAGGGGIVIVTSYF